MPRLLLTRRLVAAACLAALVLPAPAAAAPRRTQPGGPATLETALRRYLATRTGHVTVAVHDLRSGVRVLHRPGHRQLEASIVKVEILAALLARHHAPLEPAVAAQARRMIENSDNEDAQALWEQIGGGPGLVAFGRRVGLDHTRLSDRGPGYAWGRTRSTPGDQLRLLDLIAHRNDVLSDPDRHFIRQLMTHVESDQRWGVTAGTSEHTVVAVKNGWLELGHGWQINSIGWVRAPGRAYLVAVMTTGSPSMGYGIATVQGVSRIVWRHR